MVSTCPEKWEGGRHLGNFSPVGCKAFFHRLHSLFSEGAWTLVWNITYRKASCSGDYRWSWRARAHMRRAKGQSEAEHGLRAGHCAGCMGFEAHGCRRPCPLGAHSLVTEVALWTRRCRKETQIPCWQTEPGNNHGKGGGALAGVDSVFFP